MLKTNRVGVVIVSYGHQGELPKILKSLLKQKRPSDQVVVVDNHPDQKGAQAAQKFSEVKVIKAKNKGFSHGCNVGANSIIDDVDVLFFLNPDTLPSYDVLHTVRSGGGSRYAAWMPLLKLPDGRVNSAGNVVHISGLSWCDGYLNRADKYDEEKNITVLSGACAAIKVEWWKKLNGMGESYFLYYEDTDLSTRILLEGGEIALLPQSYVTHDYDYEKGMHKWLYLERNRCIYILQTWPTAVIAVLGLQLALIEIGLWLVAVRQKRFWLKVKSTKMFFAILPKVLRDRKKIQLTRKIKAYDFLQTLTYKLDTPLLEGVGNNILVNFFFFSYFKVASAILAITR
jgi:GT2 family glycosyltransferase